nr:hypothetical protein [Tanacetum cinerariifolium]
MPKVLSLAWETILEIKHALEEKHLYINTPSWDRPTICYNDDDDEDCTIEITPILSTEDPDNSLSMGDEHLDTVPAMESDKFIKSSVENLVSIPSESEGIPDNISEVMEIVISEEEGIDADILLTIKDDILREKLLNVNLLIANIKALKDNPTPYFDFMTNGSATTHSDSSLYDSFIFDLSINPFPHVDMCDFYHEEFADELAYIISPSIAPQYLLSFENEDTIFDPGISNYHISSFMPDVSHRSRTFIKFNMYPKHLKESPMEILFSTCSSMDQ